MINWLVVGSIVSFFVMLAVILWWAWRQETASRFADTLDRRFAPYKTQPKEREELKPLKAYLDWVNWRGELEQRVTALEDKTEILEFDLHELEVAATPSPPTASPTTGSPSDAAERDYTPRLSPASWRSDQRIIKGGHAERLSEFAEPEDAWT